MIPHKTLDDERLIAIHGSASMGSEGLIRSDLSEPVRVTLRLGGGRSNRSLHANKNKGPALSNRGRAPTTGQLRS